MKPHIALSLCSRDNVCIDTVFDIADMVKHSECDVELQTVSGHTISMNRHILVRLALENRRTTHIMFIDSDMRFPHDAADKLLGRGLSIVGANYRWRIGPKNWTSEVPSVNKSGVERVHHIGFGCALIEREVFEALPTPWFNEPYILGDDGVGGYMSDDVFFCNAAMEAGFHPAIDHDLSQRVRHIGTIEWGVNL